MAQAKSNNSKLIIYDTLSAVKRMVEGGVTKKTAEAVAEEILHSQESYVKDLVTKQELEIAKKDIIIKLGSMMFAGFGIVIAILLKMQ